MIDWDQVLSKAIMGGVIGAVVGGCAGIFAYLNRKKGASEESEWEERERARIRAQLNPRERTANTVPVWFFLVVILAIIVGVLAAKPEFVERLLPR